jgi:hypothetical protein
MAAARQCLRLKKEDGGGGALRGQGRGGGVLRGRDEVAVCLRTAGGGMTCLGRQKSKRVRRVEKLLSVAKESVGPEILR